MKLTTLLTTGLALLIVGVLATPDNAEAKRFGGGGSFGKQSKTMPRQAQPAPAAQKPTQAAGQPAAAGAAGKTSGASRWLGPLAGLAAGGLLASLFFGDGFEGFQMMDFLLIAALAFGGFMLFRMFKRNQTGPRPATYGGPVPSTASGPSMGQNAPLAREAVADPSTQTQAPRTGSVIPPAMGDAPPQSTGQDQFPHWFDGIAFLDGAKTHFIRLQTAWDKGDFRDIRDYTTPQLFAELQRERERLGGEQYTEVVQLTAQMVTIVREGDQVVASIRFGGLIREDSQGVAEPFNEVWHVQHPWDSAEGDWLIAGIQQD